MSTRNRITLPDNASALNAVRSRNEFDNKTGTLTARYVEIPSIDHEPYYSESDGAIIIPTESEITVNCVRVGSLPEQHREQLLTDIFDARQHHGGIYVVWSYDTPIMWRIGEHTTVPSVRYSLTTTRHQKAITGGYFSGSESARAGKGQSPYGPRNGGF
jgi:hypothetical protein